MAYLSTTSPRVYDAMSLLGLGEPCDDPLPDAAADEVVVRYGGWSLQELRYSDVGRSLMCRQDWYCHYEWSRAKLPSGLYVVRLPVPESNRRSFKEQKSLLLPDEEPAPVVLAATALLCHRLKTSEDLLKGDWSRCKEQTSVSTRATLLWGDGQLYVSGDIWINCCGAGLWIAASRKIG